MRSIFSVFITQDRLRAQPGYSSVATLSGLQESDYPALSTQSSSSMPALNLPEAAARYVVSMKFKYQNEIVFNFDN